MIRLKHFCGCLMVVVGAAFRFRDDLVDQPHFEQVRRGDLQCLRGNFGFTGIAPHDRSAALWRDHRVHRIFQHVHAIADRDRQRAAGTAFTGDDHQNRHREPRHFAQIMSDRFGLTALFGIDARISAWRIDEDKDRPPEFRGELHRAQCFAIAFRLCLAEITREALFGVASFLIPYDHDRFAVKFGHTGDQRGIVGEIAVAVDFEEIFEQNADVIVGVRALRVTRQKQTLPGAEIGVEIALEFVHFLADSFDLDRLFAGGR